MGVMEKCQPFSGHAKETLLALQLLIPKGCLKIFPRKESGTSCFHGCKEKLPVMMVGKTSFILLHGIINVCLTANEQMYTLFSDVNTCSSIKLKIL